MVLTNLKYNNVIRFVKFIQNIHAFTLSSPLNSELVMPFSMCQIKG